MQNLLGVACLMAVGVTTPQAEVELSKVTPQAAVAIAASEPLVPSVTDFVVKKRLAPIAREQFIEAALQPTAPALPVGRDVKIQTAKKVVDQILKETPRVVPQSVEVIEQSLAKEEADGWATVRSIARSNAVPISPQVQNHPVAKAVVDTVKNDANSFIVPDVADDQFIVAPRPISKDFQDQLQPAGVAPEVLDTNLTADLIPDPEAVAAEVLDDVADVTDSVAQPVAIEAITPTETEQIEPTKVETVNVTVDEPQPADVDIDVVPETNDIVVSEVVIQDAPTVSAGDAELMEVIDGWTSLDQSTRQSILLLLRADQVVKTHAAE